MVFLSTNTNFFLLHRENIYLEYKSSSGMAFEECLEWYASELKTKGTGARKCILYIRYLIFLKITDRFD